MIARKASLTEVLHVAHNMREWDRKEIFACMFDDSVDTLAMSVVSSQYSFVLGNTEPIAVMWSACIRPGVWSIGMFATEKIGEIGLGLNRFAKRVFIRGLVESGAHRAEAKTMDGHYDAKNWMVKLGAEYEATHPFFGRNGEKFHTFAWTKESKLYPFWR